MEIQLDPARGEVRLGRLHLDPRRMNRLGIFEMEKITEMEGRLRICYDIYIYGYIYIWLYKYIYVYMVIYIFMVRYIYIILL
jgi:hypothetical protein